MEKLLEPAKVNYLLMPHQPDMHNEATDWLSDLEFCKTELSFLGKLLNKYFLRINTIAGRKGLLDLEKKVKLFTSKTYKSFHDQVIQHEQMLGWMDADMFLLDEHIIREDHKRISLTVRLFIGTVRKLKKEIFSFVETEIKRNRK